MEKLSKLPKEFMMREVLSRIGSIIGRPLFMDEPTIECTRLAIAPICMEVEVNGEFLSTLEVMVEDGNNTSIFFEYSWVPTYCNDYKRWGHRLLSCRTKAPIPKGPKDIAKQNNLT